MRAISIVSVWRVRFSRHSEMVDRRIRQSCLEIVQKEALAFCSEKKNQSHILTSHMKMGLAIRSIELVKLEDSR
jgi:hypothetical protein